MTNVGTHGQTCLSADDPAAVALSLQCNAEAIDAALSGINTALNDYLGRWWWSATNVGAVTVTNAAGTVLPDGYTGADLLTDGGSLAVQANGFAATASFPVSFVWPPGIYLAGSTVKYTVATPNNNTQRTLLLYAVDRIDGIANIATTADEVYKATEYEHSAAGGDGSIEVTGLVKVEANMVRIGAGFAHANTSSTIVIPIGAWRLWYIYLGSGLVI